METFWSFENLSTMRKQKIAKNVLIFQDIWSPKKRGADFI